MRIVFLTTDDPIYLPAFFERIFDMNAKQTLAVYIVPPLYKNQSGMQAAWRYFRTFGIDGISGLVPRIAWAKVRRQSIASTCRKQDITYGVVRDVNSPTFLDCLDRIEPDLIVSVSCPQIFKKPLIELPPLGCLNIHGAFLPHYRGVMPSFWMLANNEIQAGVSIYYVDEKIDAGELCAQQKFDILPNESLDKFLRRSKAIAADLLIDVLNKIEQALWEEVDELDSTVRGERGFGSTGTK